VIDGTWLAVKRTDPRAFALYRHHYSAEKNLPYRAYGNTNVTGPAATMTLLSKCGRALFVWIRNTIKRWDAQVGVNCAIFRNEGAGLSSDLIREADDLAWGRWPGERHWTYVNAEKTRRRRSKRAPAGKCFIEAGWRECGTSAEGLVILERTA
jgi:hypothetical protein